MNIECNWCTLKIDKDNMHALMCLHAYSGDDAFTISKETVMNFLADNKIVNGIISVAVDSLVEHSTYEQYVCVAKGTPAARGQDGHYKYEKNTSDMKKKPVILDDGTADYKNSLNLAMINAGELLAVYIPPTDGVAGCDIFGNYIPPLAKGKDILPLRGRGIVAGEDKRSYYAEYSGHIVMDGNKIYIDKLYRVDGDLNIETGNIRFDGDVEVTGDVRSGLTIDAKGDIFIHGHVGACKITSGKSITIEKGVQGRGDCIIKAAENVVCKFVESCTINAGQNIYADSVLSSTLVANKQVIVTAKHGNVISSEVYGMAGVIVTEAGNSAGAPTLLRAGLPREYYTKASELTKLIAEADTKTAALNQHLESIEKADQSDPKISDMRMKIIRAKVVLSSTKSEYMAELGSLSEKIKQDATNSFIRVNGTVYEGVRIYIGSFPYLVNEAVMEVTFKIRNNEIVVCL